MASTSNPIKRWWEESLPVPRIYYLSGDERRECLCLVTILSLVFGEVRFEYYATPDITTPVADGRY